MSPEAVEPQMTPFTVSASKLPDGKVVVVFSMLTGQTVLAAPAHEMKQIAEIISQECDKPPALIVAKPAVNGHGAPPR